VGTDCAPGVGGHWRAGLLTTQFAPGSRATDDHHRRIGAMQPATRRALPGSAGNATVVTTGAPAILRPFARSAIHCTCVRRSSSVSPHPLDSLSTEEFRRTTAALRASGDLIDSRRFASITLDEPAKAAVLAWREGDPIVRRSRSVLWDRADNKAYEAIVALAPDDTGAADEVVSFDHVPDVTPNFTVDEWHDCDVAMKADPRVVAALAERGLTDLDLVCIDVWTYGKAMMPEKWRDRRLGWADIWVRSTPTGNPYANPVSGMKLIVDMNTMELLEIDRADAVSDPSPVMG